MSNYQQSDDAFGRLINLIFSSQFIVFVEFGLFALGAGAFTVSLGAHQAVGWVVGILVLSAFYTLLRTPQAGIYLIWTLTSIWGLLGGFIGWHFGYAKTETHPPDWVWGSFWAVIGACVLFSIGFGIHSRVRNNALGVGGEGESSGNYNEEPSISSGGRQSLASLSMPRGGPKSFVFRVTQRNDRGIFMLATMQYVRANSRWDAERQIKGQYPPGTLIMYLSEE
jgi:hypothetical protein